VRGYAEMHLLLAAARKEAIILFIFATMNHNASKNSLEPTL